MFIRVRNFNVTLLAVIDKFGEFLPRIAQSGEPGLAEFSLGISE